MTPLTPQQLNCLAPGSVRLEGSADGPLAGTTFVCKDMFAIAGHTSSFGHRRWRETHSPSPTTAPAVDALLGAGARMEGLAKLDQLAYSMIGNAGEGEPPLNPTALDRFCGGSSSGPASAVAGGLCDFGVGTDTGGSIRVPAACCGLFSLRPTHGRLDADGVLPLAPSFDAVGLLARDPTLLRAAFAAMLGAAAPPQPPLERVLLPIDGFDGLDPAVAAAVSAHASTLGARGIEVEKASFERFASPAVADLFSRVQAREIWATHAGWVAENLRLLAPDVAARMERAELLSRSSAGEIAADLQMLDDYRGEYDELIVPGTAILLPVTPGPAPLRVAGAEELQAFRVGSLRWTAPASLTGSPQVVVPVLDGAGASHGVGLLGARGEDVSLLATASLSGDN
jgi:amidase